MPSHEVLDIQLKQRWERRASHHRGVSLGRLQRYRLAAMLSRGVRGRRWSTFKVPIRVRSEPLRPILCVPIR
jgi:hypothetical protein